tara:strand:- start:587 stop:1504 length:918 start_codon:yes stop_codon:yes gene_type:complete
MLKNKNYQCNVCLNKNTKIIYNRLIKRSNSLKWFERSILEILNIKQLNYQINFCLNCFHIFVSNNINSNLLYSNEASKIRKNLFTNEFPNKKYSYNLDNKFHYKSENKRINIIKDDILDYLNKSNQKKIKILDFGGDDGYLSNKIFELIENKYSKRVLFDIYDPQIINNLSSNTYDIIILSHVLEHISNLDEFFLELKKYISKKTLLLIEVPDERSLLYKILFRRNIYLDYHLNFFSISSIKYFFKKNNYKLDSKYIFSSYRGNKLMTIYSKAMYFNNKIKISKFYEIFSLIMYLPRKLFLKFLT